ncbi:MAG: hypothetical protein A2041_07465 [Bacteroidetes bacterium GWA2_31_9b]|nr:MAG: hypothetical protein A2041_07465 [Bacteroidetes bacterium GWA2_31_9b]
MLPGAQDKNEYWLNNERHIITNRLKYLSKSSNHFNSILPEVEAVFGKNVKKKCSEVNSIFLTYKFSLNEYFQLFGRTNNDEHYREIRADIYKTSNENDLQKELEKCIEEIENEISKNV